MKPPQHDLTPKTTKTDSGYASSYTGEGLRNDLSKVLNRIKVLNRSIKAGNTSKAVKQELQNLFRALNAHLKRGAGDDVDWLISMANNLKASIAAGNKTRSAHQELPNIWFRLRRYGVDI